ncbi:MAG: amidase domain-containing protein [Bacillota bacterium]
MLSKSKKLATITLITITLCLLFGNVFAYAASYNGSSAASYADSHAIYYNYIYKSFTSDCANFVSQAFYAGGWPFANTSYSTTSPYAWYYKDNGTVGYTADDSNTVTWSAARNLYSYIVQDSSPSRGTWATANPYAGTTSDPYPDNTSIGDAIFYDWTSDAVIDHVGIYAANGTDPNSGYSGALTDQHTTDRSHSIWSLSYYNADRNTTSIYPVHLYSSF